MEKDSKTKEPVIYVVATPIGNLEDITLRASRVLSECDLIAAEDTRVTLKLLSLLGIKNKKLESYHDKSEHKKAASLIEKVETESLALALVSDAGTPLISDPGFQLIRLAHKKNIKVVPVPGASAFTSLVSSSGLPNSKLFFTGFLPKKDNLRKEEITSWHNLKASVVFFESALRIVKTLEFILEIHPSSEVCLGKELTKLYETIITSSCKSVLDYVKNELTLKGEFVVMVSLPEESQNLSEEDKEALVLKALEDHPKARAKELAGMLKAPGFSSKEAYELILKLRG